MSDSAGTAQLVRTVTIKANGAPLSDAVMERLVESRVAQSVGTASRLELRLNDDDFALIDGRTFDLGTELSVALSDQSGVESAVFVGEITAVGIEQVGDALHQLVVEAFDRSHRLGQTSKVRTFVKLKHSEIVSKIAGEHGLRAQVTDTKITHEYILQQGTDWAMLDELAFRTGMEWMVDGQKLIFRERPTAPGPKTELGVDLVKFRARFSGSAHVKEVNVRSWDPARKVPWVGVDAISSGNPEGSNNPAGATKLRSGAVASFGAGKLVTSALTAETAAEAKTLATSIATRNASHELTARGEMLGNPKVKAGARLTVNGVGTKMSGDYYLTTVEHIFGKGDLITKFTAGGSSRDGIVDLLGRQSPAIGSWAASGLVAGVVTNIKDPDGLNRVKVKFPGLSEEDESHWARIVSPMAGSAVGLVMMPSINDEVLVGFEQGDFRRPYVLGALWNTKDKPPFLVKDSKIVEYALKTRSGHVMSFGEEASKEAIKLVHGKAPDSKLVLEDKKVQLWVNGENMVEIKAGGATIVLDKGDIKISGKNIEIKGTAAVKIDAPTVEIKASAQLKMQGTAVELKGSATVSVQASGPLTLKGAMTAIN